MKYHGDIDLNRNLLQNMVLPADSDFPLNPLPGMLCFKLKKLFFCAEIANGLPVWVPMTQVRETYVHAQIDPATVWTIPHNLGSTFAFVQVQMFDGTMLYPDTVDTTNPNTATITFAAPQDGRAIIMVGKDITTTTTP